LLIFGCLTESIQDTRHVIHSNAQTQDPEIQKPVSNTQAPGFISRKSMLQSFNLKSQISNRAID